MQNLVKLFFLCASFVLIVLLNACSRALIAPTNLTCELIQNPVGIDIRNPDLSYNLHPLNVSERGLKQTSFQILVSSSLDIINKAEGDMWNSGKVNSDKTTYITYAGKPLRSSQNQSEKPGYGYQLKMGATAHTEKWDADIGSFGSHNHFVLGQINEWFFHDLLGIGVEPDRAGFRKIVIKPVLVSNISWVKGLYQSVCGLISVEWKSENGVLTLNVSIPVNTFATLYIPVKKEIDVKESGKQAFLAKGIKLQKMENGNVIFEVASGNYSFTTSL